MAAVTEIRVLIAKEGEYWVAQCLEYDIGAQARDLDQLRGRLLTAIESERQESMRRHGMAFFGIDPAPRYFHELWEGRAKTFTASQPSVLANSPEIKVQFGLAA